jgi:hypothetical protein
MDEVPLHGVGHMPNGPGPYPLVLIVHGNHSPTDPSYDGYNYLTELLASHCMIAISIEEDFLNGNVGGEMDARGIVLLRHLQLWREWTRDPTHPYYGMVDLSNIGLSGHSRGGEAIVAAELFNTSLHDFSDPEFNFNFDIEALYAIAPVDGQFDGTPSPITLKGADYYVMHGSHDGDVWTFPGHKMYNRAYPVTENTSNYKGFLWIHGANHGQWNSGWGTCCEGTYTSPTARISEPNQMQFAKLYIPAVFLKSLKSIHGYKYFLNDEVSFSSIPSGIKTVRQYQDPERLFLNHFEEDDNLSSGSQTGITNSTIGSFENYDDYAFSDRTSGHFLWGQTDGLIAGWRDDEPTWQVEIPAKNDEVGHDYEFLAFHVGQTFESTADLNTVGINKDFKVQLEFNGNPGPEIKVSSIQDLIYPLKAIRNNGASTNASKSIKQTIRIPISSLTGRELADKKSSDVNKILFKFNVQNKGNIALDELQFTN